MKILFVLCFCLFCGACSQQYAHTLYDRGMISVGLKTSYHTQREANWILARDTNIAIALHSRLDVDDFPRTNQLFRKSASRIFTQQFPHASILASQSDTHFQPGSNLALANKAFQNQYEILLIAELSAAENNLDSRFEVSGGRFQNPERRIEQDHLVIQFLIYESISGQLLDRIRLDTRAAYFKEESHAPMHLIEETLHRAASQLAAF